MNKIKLLLIVFIGLPFLLKGNDYTNVLIKRNIESLGSLINVLEKGSESSVRELQLAASKNEMSSMAFIFWYKNIRNGPEKKDSDVEQRIRALIILNKHNILKSQAFENADPLLIELTDGKLRRNMAHNWGESLIDESHLNLQSYKVLFEHFKEWMNRLK